MAVLDVIREMLDKESIEYKCVHHEPTRTSEESAKARGEEMKVGGKALVMKVGDEFYTFVISAILKADAKKIRAHLGARKSRFATPEELMELTGLVPGSVPPFGKPIIPLKLFVDTSITQNEKIAFNAGSLTDSIILSVDDYLRIARPEVFDFSEEEE